MKLSSLKIYLLKSSLKRKGVYFLIIAIFVAIFCLPKISSLAYTEITANPYFNKIQMIVSSHFKPETKNIHIYVTAYSSSPDETDDTPCIAASGYDLCKHDRENVVACNFLPFGTKVRFPELDADRTYTVVDRMHERFNSRMDIWMKSKEAAKNFGKKYLTVEIYR